MLVDKAKEIKKENNNDSQVLHHSNRITYNMRNSKNSQDSEENKVDAIIVPNADDVEEPSMYEDAIRKPIPIMNSTLKHSPLMLEKPLNATVVLERLPQSKLNETVVIQKGENARNSKRLMERESPKNAPQDNAQLFEAPVQYNDCNGLITDDESSPEIKKPKRQLGKKPVNKKHIKSLSSSEDEIPNTPQNIVPVVIRDNKTTYKSTTLFSPYAKESVKKRVEAFEQAVIHSPKAIEVSAPVRVTRTKTRAMAKETETETKNAEKNLTQILARKSLAKAKRISLAKQKKNEEFKEVKESVVSYFIIILIFSIFFYSYVSLN